MTKSFASVPNTNGTKKDESMTWPLLAGRNVPKHRANVISADRSKLLLWGLYLFRGKLSNNFYYFKFCCYFRVNIDVLH